MKTAQFFGLNTSGSLIILRNGPFREPRPKDPVIRQDSVSRLVIN